MASHHSLQGALDSQGPCRGEIQLLYIYFIACTVTLGGDHKVEDTPAPPCDLAGLDLVFNPFLPRLPYRYGLCTALLAPVRRLPCEFIQLGPSYPTCIYSPCSVEFVHNKTMKSRQPWLSWNPGEETQMWIPASIDLFPSKLRLGME